MRMNLRENKNTASDWPHGLVDGHKLTLSTNLSKMMSSTFIRNMEFNKYILNSKPLSAKGETSA